MNYDPFGSKRYLFAVLIVLAGVSPIVSRETTRPGARAASQRDASPRPTPEAGYQASAWPALPRGGEGTFQQRWATRIARDPADGVASFFTDRLGADGERLHPEDRNPKEHLCARPDPADLGSRLRITGPGGSIICRVADIGPARELKREVDLLPAGFRAIGLRPSDGLGRVRIERVE